MTNGEAELCRKKEGDRGLPERVKGGSPYPRSGSLRRNWLKLINLPFLARRLKIATLQRRLHPLQFHGVIERNMRPPGSVIGNADFE
ncbi:MAG: hypothetical protein ABL901_17695 [Hyphomicrobiaceae bacterium]